LSVAADGEHPRELAPLSMGAGLLLESFDHQQILG
jgi:hypothetical protein